MYSTRTEVERWFHAKATHLGHRRLEKRLLRKRRRPLAPRHVRLPEVRQPSGLQQHRTCTPPPVTRHSKLNLVACALHQCRIASEAGGREEDVFGVTRLEAIAELGQPLLGGQQGFQSHNHTFMRQLPKFVLSLSWQTQQRYWSIHS